VLAVGDNHFGQIGRGEFSRTVRSPQRVSGLQHKGVCLVCCGQYFAYALTESGDVYSVGRNLQGQLGLGHTNHECSPHKVKGLSMLGVFDIVCSAETAFARTVTGSAYMVGYSFGMALDGEENFLTPSRMKLQKFFVQSPKAQFHFSTSPFSDYFFILVEKSAEHMPPAMKKHAQEEKQQAAQAANSKHRR
jgi:alpha-tubulin suppressor-like RCC1 family protein